MREKNEGIGLISQRWEENSLKWSPFFKNEIAK